MPLRAPITVLALALACGAGEARADCPPCTDAGRRGPDCPPWSVCSVYAGDCEAGKAPLSVCTGHCAAGSVTRLVPSVGAYVASGLEEERGLSVGLELVPPLAGGHVAVRSQWWSGGVWRAGPALSWALGRSLRLGVGADLARARGAWAAGASGRIEVFPWALSPGLIPLQLTSLSLEAGALLGAGGADARVSYAEAGIRLWL